VTKHRDLTKNVDTVPESWVDALSEFISTFASPFRLEVATPPTSLRIAAGTGNAQVGIGINGRWRYIQATVTAAHPGGAAGEHAVFVTASDNAFSGQDIDNTVYSFGLEIRTSGNPTTAIWRQIGTVVWNGTAISEVRQTVGAVYEPARVPAGTLAPSLAVAVPAGWLLCNGATVNRADYPGLADALGVPAGNATFALPNLQGRVPVGRDAAQAEFDTLGEVGGEKTHALSSAEMPLHNHGGATGQAWSGYVSADHVHGAWTDSQGQHGHTSASGTSFATGARNAGSGTAIPAVQGYEGGTSQNGSHGHNIGMGGASSNHQHLDGPLSIGGDGGAGVWGWGAAHNNVQPYVVVNYIVKT
jgi:microcystin-dependent protein